MVVRMPGDVEWACIKTKRSRKGMMSGKEEVNLR